MEKQIKMTNLLKTTIQPIQKTLISIKYLKQNIRIVTVIMLIVQLEIGRHFFGNLKMVLNKMPNQNNSIRYL